MLHKYLRMAQAGGWRALVHHFFVAKTDDGLVQLFRYVFVGGLSAAFDVGILYVATTHLHVYYLASAAASFVVGILVNYALSVRWIFKSSGNVRTELILFSLVGLGGLALNEAFIWLFVEAFHLHYLAAKLIALALVMLWNFSLRRLLFARLNRRSATEH